VAAGAADLCRAIFSSYQQGRLPAARYLQSHLAPLTTVLSQESPAALKYALCLLGFMHPNTRLPIVELAAAAKAEVASAIAGIDDEDLACRSDGWREPYLSKASAATLQGPYARAQPR
jgi:4-hydroxy-tetrahydrodipicolinate synthase